MSLDRSRCAPARVKPAKPSPDFPLFPHATGRWAKKIGGRFAFFGPWADPDGALERFLAQREALYAERCAPGRALANPTKPESVALPLVRGRVAPVVALAPTHDVPFSTQASTGFTVGEMVAHFLSAKARKLTTGELGQRALIDYHAVCGRLLPSLGAERAVTALIPADFSALRAERAKRFGPVVLGIEIGRVRTIFKLAYEYGLIDKPVRFGPEFAKPSRRVLRLARNAAGPRLFEAATIKKLLNASGVHVRAMLLLGINAGLGNTDVSSLPKTALNLKNGVLVYPRPKTGIARRAFLWPETVEALNASLKARPTPVSAEDGGLVFITRHGRRWVREQTPGARSTGKRPAIVIDAIAVEFRKLCNSLKGQKPKLGFYALRHTFRTVADEVGDRRAIDMVMGHENGNDISTHYVERIADERLKKVAEHVRAWLACADESAPIGHSGL